MDKSRLYLSPRTPFTGISSSYDKSRLVFFGVPYDRTCTYKPGSRFGPSAIRDVSANLELYSVRANRDLEQVPISDLGDIDTVERLPDTLGRVSTVWSELIEDSKLPIMVGGEHSITKAPFDVYHDEIGLISFDAHLDLRDEFLGEKLSHATFMRRVAEKIGPDHLMEIGVRAFTKHELDYCQRSGVNLVYVRDIRGSMDETFKKIRSFASKFNRTYVTVDIDVLDPAFAPGVGNPEADGITTDELLTMVTIILDKKKTIGFDLVEVCPPLDSGQTAAVAAKVIFETMAKLG